MIAGHLYKVSFYLKAFEGNCFTNQLNVGFTENFNQTGFVFEKDEITKHGTDIPVEKVYTVPGILANKDYQQFSFEYTAKGNERFIYIGNFHLGYMLNQYTQPTTWFSPVFSARKRPYIAYAIDDIVVGPLDASEGCIKDLTPLTVNRTVLKDPDTIQLSSIYFGYNDTVALSEVSKIADTIKHMPAYKQILICGFTDNAGSLAYNQQLSEQRAQFVAAKLRRLTDEIITHEGRGLSNPGIDAKLQRRVDIYLVR